MQCKLYPSVSPLMTCKEINNLCMNRVSLDRESLDRKVAQSIYGLFDMTSL